MIDLPPSDDASQDEFYLGDVAIDPPLEEFRRTFEKKIRSFDGDGGEDRREPYTRAAKLGEAMIQRKLGEAESC